VNEQVAIIRNVGIGGRDVGRPVLWFDTYIRESSAALQIIGWEQAGELLAGIREVRELEGRPCWVEADGGMIKFLRLWEPA
jgi:hypothetical protein